MNVSSLVSTCSYRIHLIVGQIESPDNAICFFRFASNWHYDTVSQQKLSYIYLFFAINVPYIHLL